MKINKLLTIFTAIIIGTFVLSSCGDDNDDSDTIAQLLGQWDALSYEEYDCPDPNDDYFIDCTQGGIAGCYIYEFLENGEFKAILSSTSTDEGTYEIMGNVIVITRTQVAEIYEFAIDGDEMTFVSDDEPDDCSKRKILARI